MNWKQRIYVLCAVLLANSILAVPYVYILDVPFFVMFIIWACIEGLAILVLVLIVGAIELYEHLGD